MPRGRRNCRIRAFGDKCALCGHRTTWPEHWSQLISVAEAVWVDLFGMWKYIHDDSFEVTKWFWVCRVCQEEIQPLMEAGFLVEVFEC